MSSTTSPDVSGINELSGAVVDHLRLVVITIFTIRRPACALPYARSPFLCGFMLSITIWHDCSPSRIFVSLGDIVVPRYAADLFEAELRSGSGRIAATERRGVVSIGRLSCRSVRANSPAASLTVSRSADFFSIWQSALLVLFDRLSISPKLCFGS